MGFKRNILHANSGWKVLFVKEWSFLQNAPGLTFLDILTKALELETLCEYTVASAL